MKKIKTTISQQLAMISQQLAVCSG